ncbi:PepSY-associated TM helix domain-containing protein [Methylotuvimicrobium sp. KM1]|uniref:PepSY-associated TM helix domain-containing protein n=1 Tax=Methylotuvimicrobium sp. KM1 TaxID=3377707 RepID=UPI00384AB9A0
MRRIILRLPGRNVWLTLHLYLALSLGLLFVLIGLTGSLSVYREELDGFLNPSLKVENQAGNYLPLDRIMASVKEAHPARHGPWTLEMPQTSSGMVTAWYEKPHETIGELYAPLMVSVNPYTGEVVASRFWGRTLTTWLHDLHTQLRLDRRGWRLVGYLGLLFGVSILTGIYLWWPGKGRFLQVFKIRYHSGIVRLAFDLHRMIGLVGALLLPMLIVTGLHLSFPSVLENLTGSDNLGHGDQGPPIRSTAVPNDRPVTMEEAVLLARGPFPKAKLRRITTPAGAVGIYRVDLRQNEEINRRHPFTTVWVDRWSGHIKAARDPYSFTSGQALTIAIWPIHTGEALGPWGRFLWFIVGWLPLILYVSGLMVWLRRKGWFRDRPVNVPNFRPLRSYVLKIGQRIGFEGRRWAGLLVRYIERNEPQFRVKAQKLWRRCLEFGSGLSK